MPVASVGKRQGQHRPIVHDLEDLVQPADRVRHVLHDVRGNAVVERNMRGNAGAQALAGCPDPIDAGDLTPDGPGVFGGLLDDGIIVDAVDVAHIVAQGDA